jgi:hypothetical protein
MIPALVAIGLPFSAVGAPAAGGVTAVPLDLAFAQVGAPATPAPVSLAVAQLTAPAPEFAGVHYRPRSRGYSRRPPEAAGVSQLHVGWFDPDGDQGSRFAMGVRGGPMVDQHIQLGLGLDWIYKSASVSTVSSSTLGPGGVPIVVQQQISRSSVNQFPIFAFIQFTGPEDMPIVPYAGGGGGYQVMLLSGDDFVTGERFEGTFGGWGWHAWGGAAVPLGARTRLTGELYVNGAELSRDATDFSTGLAVRETVDADGLGLRFGVAWGF